VIARDSWRNYSEYNVLDMSRDTVHDFSVRKLPSEDPVQSFTHRLIFPSSGPALVLLAGMDR
jgi:hypothetical protein